MRIRWDSVAQQPAGAEALGPYYSFVMCRVYDFNHLDAIGSVPTARKCCLFEAKSTRSVLELFCF